MQNVNNAGQEQQVNDQIAGQAFQNIASQWQGSISTLQIAASIANLPNGLLVLDEMFEQFVAQSEEQGKTFKEEVSSQVGPAMMLSARSAVDEGLEQAIAQIGKRKDAICDLVRQMRGEEGDGA